MITYGKVIRYGDDFYIRYIGYDTLRCVNDSYMHLSQRKDCIEEYDGAHPERVTLREDTIGLHYSSQEVSSLAEGQIVRVFKRRFTYNGGNVIIPYDPEVVFSNDIDYYKLLEEDLRYQKFLNDAAFYMGASFRTNLQHSRVVFQRELEKKGTTNFTILSDEEIEHEVDGMKERIETLGLCDCRGGAKFVYQCHLGRNSQIFRQLDTPIMGMAKHYYESRGVLLSELPKLFVLPTNVNGILVFPEEGYGFDTEIIGETDKPKVYAKEDNGLKE